MAYEPYVGFGTRKGIVFELDSFGLPLGTYDSYAEEFTTAPYTGLGIYGIREFNVVDPEARRIPHFNGDRVELVQQFPSLEAPAGTISVDGADLNLNSVLGNVLKRTVDGMEFMAWQTDQQGNEPAVGLLVYQAAKKSTGVIGWHFQIVQSTTMIPKRGVFADSNYTTTYNLAPNSVPNHLWGEALTLAADGALSAGVIGGFSLYPPRLTTFVADGSATVFSFKAGELPFDTGYKVFKATTAGVVTEVTSGITKGLTTLTFSVAPTAGQKIMVFHTIEK